MTRSEEIEIEAAVMARERNWAEPTKPTEQKKSEIDAKINAVLYPSKPAPPPQPEPRPKSRRSYWDNMNDRKWAALERRIGRRPKSSKRR